MSPEKSGDLTVFLLSSKSDGISGKFLTAPWDPWQDEGFLNQLRNNKDMATLRRIANKMFFLKNPEMMKKVDFVVILDK